MPADQSTITNDECTQQSRPSSASVAAPLERTLEATLRLEEHPKSRGVIIPSKRRHVHPELNTYGAKALRVEENETVTITGIRIGGWDIQTSQGPIGDASFFEEATSRLEDLCQPSLPQQAPPTQRRRSSRRRQLGLPEMIFPRAGVFLYHPSSGTHISMDPMDCLVEWAVGHQEIPLPSESEDTNEGDAFQTTNSGVCIILKTTDASLWKKQKKNITSCNDTNSTATSTTQTHIGSTTFHYDWTYSSPYCGKLECINVNEGQWQSLSQSGMPMHLLMDRQAPILLYDHLVLLEDDYHDNGQMQVNVKVRVMPTCIYLLYQWIGRIDQVLMRVREVRWMIEFSKGDNTGKNNNPCTLYRNISWKECPWEDLAKYQLPTTVQAWTLTEAWNQSDPKAAARLAQLVQGLPTASLPPHLPAFSRMNIASSKNNP